MSYEPDHYDARDTPQGPVAELRLRMGRSERHLWRLRRGVAADPLDVGSADRCEWQVVAPGVRERHLRVQWDGWAMWVWAYEPGSVRVGTQSLEASWVPLEDGCELRFGEAAMRMEMAAAPDSGSGVCFRDQDGESEVARASGPAQSGATGDGEFAAGRTPPAFFEGAPAAALPEPSGFAYGDEGELASEPTQVSTGSRPPGTGSSFEGELASEPTRRSAGSRLPSEWEVASEPTRMSTGSRPPREWELASEPTRMSTGSRPRTVSSPEGKLASAPTRMFIGSRPPWTGSSSERELASEPTRMSVRLPETSASSERHSHRASRSCSLDGPSESSSVPSAEHEACSPRRLQALETILEHPSNEDAAQGEGGASSVMPRISEGHSPTVVVCAEGLESRAGAALPSAGQGAWSVSSAPPSSTGEAFASPTAGQGAWSAPSRAGALEARAPARPARTSAEEPEQGTGPSETRATFPDPPPMRTVAGFDPLRMLRAVPLRSWLAFAIGLAGCWVFFGGDEPVAPPPAPRVVEGRSAEAEEASLAEQVERRSAATEPSVAAPAEVSPSEVAGSEGAEGRESAARTEAVGDREGSSRGLSDVDEEEAEAREARGEARRLRTLRRAAEAVSRGREGEAYDLYQELRERAEGEVDPAFEVVIRVLRRRLAERCGPAAAARHIECR